MAGSRLEKFGTVFTRVRDLMRSGVVKQSDKPIWYDVYKTFPPMKDPLYVRPVAKIYGKKEEAVPNIFYREDEIRAKFYEMYGTGPRVFDLSKSSFVSTCQRFVEKYTEFESQGELEKQSLFEETGKALLAEGLVLRRRGTPAVASETRNPVLGMKLTDMLAEQQADAPGGTQTPGEEKPTQAPVTPQ
ncbi:28S ribosomal protein S23, mitochondrial isoform X1 [Salmo salar]|uniref:Small ribosomal subunit protein mS23 n=2 Tax=Salmo salar TaxID=8030 RepID=A0A1S3T1K1_SALSA|nr:28S ribosomal protein S23, mitochondrial isoform X1 [Salmo salar]|eukprot:XP_014070452.1 PREDICTED: 28S ribosomal protein S23, mitochondrial-like isoform X1 [Salmo salar]